MQAHQRAPALCPVYPAEANIFRSRATDLEVQCQSCAVGPGRDEMGSAERRKEVVQRHFVRKVGH